MKHPKDIRIEDFTYDLPAGKIAAYPKEKRDESRLLVYKDKNIQESAFKNIDSFLEKSTVLVFNNTRVIRARLQFVNEKGQGIEVFCLEPEAGELSTAMTVRRSARWNCLAGNLKRWKGEILQLKDGDITLFATLLERRASDVLIEFRWEPSGLSFSEVLERFGNTPIPPYFKRESEALDQERYQTVYASNEGSVAAPTAGLHFTGEVFQKLKEKEIHQLQVTLHVGAGTFKPVKADTLEGHDMHAEWIDVEKQVIKELCEAEERTVIAVGTTSLRTIESLYWMGLKALRDPGINQQDLEIQQWEAYNEQPLAPVKESLSALLEWMEKKGMDHLVSRTRILIAPPYTLKVVRGIITNFHQPQSTLLLLISAVVGEDWRRIYKYALDHDFRFLSYGDSSLLLK